MTITKVAKVMYVLKNNTQILMTYIWCTSRDGSRYCHFFFLWWELKRGGVTSSCITFISSFVIFLSKFEVIPLTVMFVVFVASGCFLDNGS